MSAAVCAAVCKGRQIRQARPADLKAQSPSSCGPVRALHTQVLETCGPGSLVGFMFMLGGTRSGHQSRETSAVSMSDRCRVLVVDRQLWALIRSTYRRLEGLLLDAMLARAAIEYRCVLAQRGA